jgi:hypothetical protein
MCLLEYCYTNKISIFKEASTIDEAFKITVDLIDFALSYNLDELLTYLLRILLTRLVRIETAAEIVKRLSPNEASKGCI